MGWEVAALLLKDYVSSEEFNQFCATNGAHVVDKKLDPPGADQITFDFDGSGSNPTRVCRERDRDFPSFEPWQADEYSGEIGILGSLPRTWIYIEVASKYPDPEDFLSFYRVAMLFMQRWNCVLSDLSDRTHTLGEVHSVNEVRRIIEWYEALS